MPADPSQAGTGVWVTPPGHTLGVAQITRRPLVGLEGERTVVESPGPLDLRLILGALAVCVGDPCQRWLGAELWRASAMGSGPVTYRVVQVGSDRAEVTAWGPGAIELVSSAPQLLGGSDKPEEFQARSEVLRRAERRLVGLRLGRTGQVWEALAPAVLGQKVIGLDASMAWCRLVRRYGTRAPGPSPEGLLVPPVPEVWASIPSWEWHAAGVEAKAARTLMGAAKRVGSIQKALERGEAPGQIYRMLESLPGVGPWTAAQVGQRAMGDADALSVGDYHLAELLGHPLAGRRLAETEVEPFMEPWRPHRFRVERLLELSPHLRAPRRAPRLARPWHRFY